jgi:hypothetical protein
MKTTIVIIGLYVAIMGHALAQTNQIDAPIDTNAPIKALPVVKPDEITTIAGAVYKNFRIERVDPGGLTVSYSMAGGGLGMTKITFDQLPTEWQMKYGYDIQAAAKFQSGERQAAARWVAKMIADEQAAKLIKAERDRQEEEAAKAESAKPEDEAAKEAAKKADEEKKIKAAELASWAAKKAAEAAMIRATNLPRTNIIQQQPHGD